MPTITAKNIPDTLYMRLKQVAKIHHRSINSELIRCLELVLDPQRLNAEKRLARLDAVRPNIPEDAIVPDEILESIKQGRP